MRVTRPLTSIVDKRFLIVRDDLYPGGTKARYLSHVFDDADTVVYASPCEGGAQIALAHIAHELGKTAVIVCAKRKQKHPRTLQAKALGARIVEVSGLAYLTVVQARARAYAKRKRAKLLEFGLNTAEGIDVLAQTAKLLHVQPKEVWCAASSGVLARALAQAFPDAKRHVVQVGHIVKPADVAHAKIHVWPGSQLKDLGPENFDFDSDRHYESKAWSVCRKKATRTGLVLFWNVIGEPSS